MKDNFLFFLLFLCLGCHVSESNEVNKITNSIISKDQITAIPVKNVIAEVRDETFLYDENEIIKPKKNNSSSKYSNDQSIDQQIEKKSTKKRNKEVINSAPTAPLESMKIPSPKYDPIFASNPYYIAEGFDFPVGKPNADGYFLALRFGQKLHLGEDWNGVGGGNTDLGDPVYATGDGYVTFAEHLCCGWGNTVRIIHKLDNHPYYEYIESVSSHLNDIVVQKETFVRRGDLIGHIGTADGKYSAHLHLEMRTFLDMNIGPGYSADQFGYISPTPFIRQNR